MTRSHRDDGLHRPWLRPSVEDLRCAFEEYAGPQVATVAWARLLTRAGLDGTEHDDGALIALFDAMAGDSESKVRLFGHSKKMKVFPPVGSVGAMAAIPPSMQRHHRLDERSS